MSEISIALPVYNGANYLADALDSVLAQGFSDFELVVSDNCSTDETPQILEAYARRDERIRVYRSERFLPQAENVNRAVRLCKGPWVKLLCHDDLLHPSCLSVLHNAIETSGPRLGLVGNGEEWLFANGYRHRETGSHVEQPQLFQAPTFVADALNGTSPISVPSLTTAMVRKEAWEASGGFDPRYVHFDRFLWLQVIVQWDYLFVPQLLTVNRIHGGQVAASALKSLRSVSDNDTFYREFRRRYAASLSLSWRTRLVTHLKAPSVIAFAIVVELLKNRPGRAINLALRTSPKWWPALPVLIARNFRRERQKVRALSAHVPVSLIYPE